MSSEGLTCDLRSSEKNVPQVHVFGGNDRVHQDVINSLYSAAAADIKGWYLVPGSQQQCDKCDMAFPDKILKMKHVKEKHSPSYECEICHKKFSQRSGLSHHLPTHLDVKAFQCPVCGKCFRQRSGLTHHKQTHSEVKAFTCDICGKAFAQSSGLIHHKSTHSAVKSFTCDVCGNKFAQRSGLAHHKKIHLKKFQGGSPTILDGSMSQKPAGSGDADGCNQSSYLSQLNLVRNYSMTGTEHSIF